MSTANMTERMHIGKITQVIGSTFDAEFEEERLPAIYNAVKIDSEKKGVKINLTGEVQQHLLDLLAPIKVQLDQFHFAGRETASVR